VSSLSIATVARASILSFPSKLLDHVIFPHLFPRSSSYDLLHSLSWLIRHPVKYS
jgi:hypothetical protein